MHHAFSCDDKLPLFSSFPCRRRSAALSASAAQSINGSVNEVFPGASRTRGGLREVLQDHFKHTGLLTGFVFSLGMMSSMRMKMSPASSGLALHATAPPKQLQRVSVRLASLTWQRPKQAVLFLNAEALLPLITAN